MEQNIVGIVRTEAIGYPSAPFNPPVNYPEIPYNPVPSHPNHIFDSLRRLFTLLKYDSDRYGTEEWNPLRWLIKPNDTVFIKPNMIAHRHRTTDDWDCVITHGSVVRAVLEYVCIALNGKGKIIIGDGPQTDSDFDRIVSLMGLRDIQAVHRMHKELSIEIVDLRDECWVVQDGVVTNSFRLPGDPRGKVASNLGNQSMFAQCDGMNRRYYGAFYDVDETNLHHRRGIHEYQLSGSPLVADVCISLPKLKTHKKCGLTVNLKGTVGLNANKNWLPHYTVGDPTTGGDQFPTHSAKSRLENLLVANAKRLLAKRNPLMQQLARATKRSAYKLFGKTEEIIRSGNWYGNDTAWRMALDLNRILMYSDARGNLPKGGMRKRYFSIVDGIVAMEGDGPVNGKRKEAGVLIAGANPVAVDVACATLMGFDWRRIPILARSFDPHPYPLIEGGFDSVTAASNVEQWNRPLNQWSVDETLQFEPHFGWKGHIEMKHDEQKSVNWDSSGASGRT